MGKRPNLRPRKIFLGEWIGAIPGKSRKGAADAADVDISYVNNVCGGTRENPTSLVMLAFAEYLGITVDDLYRPPPSTSALKELATLSSAAREALLRRQNGVAKPREKKTD